MRASEFTTEAPLGDLQTFGDMSPRDDAEPKKVGRSQAAHNLDNPSRKLLTGDLKRYYDAFSKTPFTINIYVTHLDKKEGDGSWWERRRKRLKDVEKAVGKDPNGISVIYTNNITSEEGYIPMTPWILAHRLAHAFSSESQMQIDKDVIMMVIGLADAYEERAGLSEKPGFFDTDVKKFIDYIWPYIATMKTARDKKPLSSELDVAAEFLAQYLINGKITLNKKLPPTLPSIYMHRREIEQVMDQTDIAWTIGQLEEDLNKYFENLLSKAVGRVLTF